LVQTIADTFPVTANSFEASLAATLLSNLSLYFWSLDYPRSGLADCHRAVDLARPVLKALAKTDLFADRDTAIQDLPNELSSDGYAIIGARRPTQKHRKRASRAQKPSEMIDRKSFDNLGVDVPATTAGACHLAEEILHDQKRILQVRG
jgi:hypothetical protein